MKSNNPFFLQQAATINEKLQFLSTLFDQSVRILYANLKPENFYNAYASNIQIDYAIFPTIFKYFYTLNQNEVNLVLENYANNVQSFLTYCDDNNLSILLNDNIVLLKDSMVSLNNLAKNLLIYDLSLSYKYTVPNNMSIRRIMFNNNKDFNDPDQVQQFLDLNASVLQDLNNIPQGTVVTIVKNGVGL